MTALDGGVGKCGGIGVVIPFRNSAQELPRQLDSIYSQTRKAAQVILVDDASSDESIIALNTILSDFPEVEVIRCDTHMGAANACTVGLLELSTEYVCFLSANDLTLPEFFERSGSLLDSYPTSPICISNIYSYNEESREYIYSDLGVSRSETYIKPELALKILKRSYFTAQTNSCMFRRDQVTAMGGMPTELQSFADAYLVFRCMVESGFCYIPAPLAIYMERKLSYSVSHKTNRLLLASIIENYIQLVEVGREFKNQFREIGISPTHDLWTLWWIGKTHNRRWFLSARFIRRCILYSIWGSFRKWTPLSIRNRIRRFLVLITLRI